MPALSRSRFKTDSLLLDCKKHANWICWAEHRNSQKNYKVPINVDRFRQRIGEFESASYWDKSIRMSYEETVEHYEESDAISGIGFVMMGVPFSYIDLDNCVDPTTNEVTKEAKEVMDRVDSYTEFSTSGTGLHIIFRGPTPTYGWSHPDHNLKIGVFNGSWVTVTENHVEDTPFKVTRADGTIESICDEFEIDTHDGW